MTHDVIGAAIEVHKELGPGLLERIYENALCIELTKRNIRYTQQQQIAAKYKDQIVGDLIVDLLVEGKGVVEPKSVKELTSIHEAQLIAYLKLAKIKTGLLINFNGLTLKKGIRRISV
ncbi:MAG: GxxExxY protein [Chloroflexi bacterium]|nr:GxxExxY protein [Chloroflexota bacterium]